MAKGIFLPILIGLYFFPFAISLFLSLLLCFAMSLLQHTCSVKTSQLLYDLRHSWHSLARYFFQFEHTAPTNIIIIIIKHINVYYIVRHTCMQACGICCSTHKSANQMTMSNNIYSIYLTLHSLSVSSFLLFFIFCINIYAHTHTHTHALYAVFRWHKDPCVIEEKPVSSYPSLFNFVSVFHWNEW